MGEDQLPSGPGSSQPAQAHGPAVAVRQVSYRPPERLDRHHDVSDFQCASEEQTSWLRKYARQADAAGTSRVFVVTEDGDPAGRVVAYYAWCMSSVMPEDAPARLRKGAGNYAQPMALFTRLGVDLGHERKGLGAGLLQDMFARLLEMTEAIGCRGLLVHCETPQARDFYLHLIPEFEASPTSELHLVLLMKDIRKSFLGG